MNWRISGLGILMTSVMAFSAGAPTITGCGGGDETPTPEPATSPSPSPEPESTDVTFKVDVSTKADGTNLLAEVKSGETVYLVGNLTGWNPNNSSFAMTDEGSGIWSITLTFPLETADYDGNPLTINIGDAIEYKFAKTTSDTSDAWAEGEKDYQTTEEQVCPANTTGAPGGLWEVSNRVYTITSTDETISTVTIDAWRETAEAFGYASCNG